MQIISEKEMWYCPVCTTKRKTRASSKQRKSAKDSPEGTSQAIDHKLEYTKALLWRLLGHMARRDAIRENDGPVMVSLWKIDMLDFHSRNHYKYTILGHRLLAGRWKKNCNQVNYYNDFS